MNEKIKSIEIKTSVNPESISPAGGSFSQDYIQKKYDEIKKADQSNNFVDVLRHIEEVEKYKLNFVAEKENKEGNTVKILGRGLEYTVYDIGNSRIQARHNSIEEQNDILLSWLINDEEKRRKIIETLNTLTVISMKIVKTLLDQKKINGELLGNPIFKDGNNDYTRDEATSFSNSYIESHSLEENKAYVEKYISLVHTLWSSGVCDTTFKFMENNGITKNNDVIQRDIGEFAFTKEKIFSLIEDKKWLKQNYRFIPEGPLKEYIEKRFSEEFSLEKLEEFWPKEETGGDSLNKERELWQECYLAYSESWS